MISIRMYVWTVLQNLIFTGLILYATLQEITAARLVQSCTFLDYQRECQMVRASTLSSVKFPRHACIRQNCQDCMITWETRVLKDNVELVEVDTYRLQQEPQENGTTIMYQCQTADGSTCGCEEQTCAGTPRYCALEGIECEPLNPCTCDAISAKSTIVAMVGQETIENPVVLSYKICLFQFPDEPLNDAPKRRRLLSEEEAVFETGNLIVRFHDPIFTLPNLGTLIVRKGGQEVIAKITEAPLQFVTPESFLILPGSLKFLFVTPHGETIQGIIRIEGRQLCRKLPCIFCLDLLNQLECLPPVVLYVVYAILIILTAILVLYIKAVLKALLWFLQGIITIFKKTYALLKATGRFSMLTGLVTGDVLRRRAQNVAHDLEHRALAMNQNIIATVLITIALLPLALADCTNQQVLHSDVRDCREYKDHQNCKMWTQAQVTLTNLENTQCLWFTDRAEQNLFKLELTFREARCEWPSQRMYYTFPTDLRVISMISCSQNMYCGHLTHCHRGYPFPSLTQESLDYPGIQDCQSIHGYGVCTLYNTACHHYRIYLVPDLTKVYEVRKISGYSCEYIIDIKEENNGTVETLLIKDHAVSRRGIEIRLVGTLDQPVQILATNLIVRVGNQDESYLEKASDAGRPHRQQIGDVQANTSYTKQFIFDEGMVSCKFLDERMVCEKQQTYLMNIIQDKTNLLPMTQDFHRFSLNTRGALTSQMLQSAPLLLHLSFSGYNFSIETHAVCPRITGPLSKPVGCYSCNTLAQLTLFAYSTCLPGTVQVTFETLQIYTRTLKLTTEAKAHTIDFKAEHKCIQEKICLVGKNLKACEGLNFCLQEPTLRLNYPNISSAFSFSGSVPSSWEIGNLFSADWGQYFSNIFKYPLYLLVSLVIALFLISMILSLCRR